MSENNFKNKEKSKKKKEYKSLKTLHSIVDGSFLAKSKIVDQLPFFFYLMGIAILLIFNSYYAEKKVRDKEVLREYVNELRIKYITTKSELMFITNQSVVAQKLKKDGLIESTTPPRIIEKPEKRGNFLLNIVDRKTN